MIAYLINELDVRGGTHKQLLKLLDYTADRKIDFFVLTKRVDYAQTYSEFGKYRDKIIVLQELAGLTSWKRSIKWFRYALQLRKALKNTQIINVHDNGFEMYFATLPDKEIYWQINDLPPCFQTGVFANRTSWKNVLKRLWIRLGVRLSIRDISVNVSKNRTRVQKYLHHDAHVFYCGIEPLSIERSNDETFKRFDNNTVHLLSSGVFFPYRNYETQIKVVKQLLDSGIKAELNIIGATADNAYTEKIRTLIQQTGLQQHIHICGSVNEREFNQLHKQADLFIFVNIDQSWGLAVFEAMSCGLPVLVSTSVGATEILKDRTNTLFVDPTDSRTIATEIIHLMQDRTLYESISSEAKKLPKQYTWNNAYSSQMLNLLMHTV